MKLTGETKLLLIMGGFVLLGGGTLVGMNMASSGAIKLPPIVAPTPAPTPVAWTPDKFDALVKNAAHVRGDGGAPVTVVEFADFECPSCRKAYNDTISKWEKSGMPVRFVFHHFPWPYHERALPAARAAEAAGKQGKFWPMYDALFTGEDTEMTDDFIRDAAKKIGLDMNRFEKDWKDEAALTPLITADQNLGKQFAVNATPTFVVKDKAGKIQEVTGAAALEALLAGKPLPADPNPPPAPAAP